MKYLDFTFAFLFCVFTLGFVDLEIKYSDGSKFKWVGWISRIVRYKENKNRTKYAKVVHGRWVQKEFWTGGGTWRCSECGRQIMFMKGTPTTEKMHYCPNCGSDMRGTEE